MVAAELSAELYQNRILEVFWRIFVRTVAACGAADVIAKMIVLVSVQNRYISTEIHEKKLIILLFYYFSLESPWKHNDLLPKKEGKRKIGPVL